MEALILHGLSNCTLSDPIGLRWKPNLLGQGQHQAEDGPAAHMQTTGLKKDYLSKSAQLEEQMACVVCWGDGVAVYWLHQNMVAQVTPIDHAMGSYPKACWELWLAVDKYLQENKPEEVPWEPGGCLPASQGGAARRSWSCWNNHSQGQVAPGNLALILHPVKLHPAPMNVISEKRGLAKGRLRSVNSEFKAFLWGLRSQNE